MRCTVARTLASCALLIVFAAAVVRAQQPPQGRGAGPGPGRIGGAVGAYPARPPAEPAALERGKAVYGTYCTFCHGADSAADASRSRTCAATLRRLLRADDGGSEDDQESARHVRASHVAPL